MQCAIEGLRQRAPHLSLAERRKLASLRMNLRILEDLSQRQASASRPDGDEAGP